MNDIETSDPPRHPAARRHLRGPGRKSLTALVLSGVALVIFGRLARAPFGASKRRARSTTSKTTPGAPGDRH